MQICYLNVNHETIIFCTLILIFEPEFKMYIVFLELRDHELVADNSDIIKNIIELMLLVHDFRLKGQ
jgi:hypothetical protein